MEKRMMLLGIAAALFLASGLLYPAYTSPVMNVKNALSELCSGLMSMLPVAAMLAVLAGSAVYASGQIMGAETRARANVWATNLLVGALFAMLIVAVTPPVLGAVYGGTVNCT